MWEKLYTREYSLLLIYSSLISLIKKPEILRTKFSNAVTIPSNKMQSVYIGKKDLQLLSVSLKKQYLSNSKKLTTYLDNFKEFSLDFIKELKGLKILNKQENLIKNYHIFIDKFVEFNAHLWVTFILNNLLDKGLLDVISTANMSNSDRERIIRYSTQPEKLASTLLLNAQLSKLPDKELEKRFAWMTTIDFFKKPAEYKDLKLMGTIELKNSKITTPRVFNKLAKNTKDFIKLSRELVYIKDLRDDYRRKIIYNSIPLFSKISKCLGMSRKELSYLSPNEVEKGLIGKGEQDDLKTLAGKRIVNGFVLYISGKNLLAVNDNKKIKNIITKYKLEDKYISDTEDLIIKGTVASKGKARGEARVLSSAKEIGIVRDGDILVSVTTNPDYVPAMKKAVAFVTDEGGITSHAAIVAREMEKPCLVGTKVSTKVFKSGEIVFVDAVEGFVKSLSSN